MAAQIMTTMRELYSRTTDGINIRLLWPEARSCRGEDAGELLACVDVELLVGVM
jgi:hypothetical protein